MADQYIYQYENISVAYHKLGEGKPLVILHGWGSSSRVMMPLAQQMKHLRTCYVVDLPGFGDSQPPPEAWNIDNYANLIQKFIIDHFEGPVDFLVHSFGGRITLKLCARPFGQKRIQKVLITGGAGMKPRRSLTFYLKKYAAKLLKAPFLILPEQSRDKVLSRLRQSAVWKLLGSSDYSKLSGVMRETFVKSVTEHLESTLPNIPHEVLLLWGKNDDATPLYQAQRMENGLENGALVVIENAGHYAFLDRPKHFASIAEAFFE